MRIVIASVLTRARLSDLLCPVTETVRRLLAHATVSALYLLVACSHRQLFDENIACCDSRLKIVPIIVGSSFLSHYRWHYKDLPQVAAQLRADAVYLSYPVFLKKAAFYPATGLSLGYPQPPRSVGKSSVPKAVLERWILKQCLGVLSKTECDKEVSLQQFGLLTVSCVEKATSMYNHTDSGRKIAPRSVG